VGCIKAAKHGIRLLRHIVLHFDQTSLLQHYHIPATLSMHFCKYQELQLEAPPDHVDDLSSHVGETLTLERQSIAAEGSRFSTTSTRALSAGRSGISYRQDLSYDAELPQSFCPETSTIEARLHSIPRLHHSHHRKAMTVVPLPASVC
jgi:hypothetical protein